MALKKKRTSFKEFSGEKKVLPKCFSPQNLSSSFKNQKQKNLEDFFFVKAVICKINKVLKFTLT